MTASSKCAPPNRPVRWSPASDGASIISSVFHISKALDEPVTTTQDPGAALEPWDVMLGMGKLVQQSYKTFGGIRSLSPRVFGRGFGEDVLLQVWFFKPSALISQRYTLLKDGLKFEG